MTLVSNDPTWWPTINTNRIASYFIVAASAGIVYDWVLTLGQEVELVWTQRWSLMSILYLSVRYLGISYAILQIIEGVPTISLTDIGCQTAYIAITWMTLAVSVMLGVITTTRLYAMYQRSRKMLIFLVVTLLAINISNGVILSSGLRHSSEEELVLFGTYQCNVTFEGNTEVLRSLPFVLTTVWEIIALCLALWISVHHFRDLQRHSAGGIIGDFVTVLVKTHVAYFASFVAVSMFWIGGISPTFNDFFSLRTEIYRGFLQVILVLQLFVVGPRLILSVRRYRAELMADSDAGTGLVFIALQERAQVSTSATF